MEPTLTEADTTFENLPPPDDASQQLAERIKAVLEEHSALDILDINTRGKSSVADSMLIASGRSNRHVAALADYVRKDLKEIGHEPLATEGTEKADWVLIDAGDVILHLFRPEVRVFYNLEKIWSLPLPESLQNLAEAAPEE